MTAPKISTTTGLPQAGTRAERKRWATPRVILSAVRDYTSAAHTNNQSPDAKGIATSVAGS